MAQRLPAQVYADLVAAGFSPSAAVTMTAIAGGESGYDPASVGDIGKQTAAWGPSFGLFQIRTLKTETGKGTPRDIQWLAASPANQARAAYLISSGGSNFTPWSVYTSGAWRSFAATAQSAAGAARDIITVGTDGPLPTVGPDWAPWNWPSNAGNAALAQTLGGARNLAVEALVVILGLAVVGLGIARVASPATRRGWAVFNGARGKVKEAIL